MIMGTELFIVDPTGSGRPDYSLDAIVVTDYVYFDAGSPYTGITYPVGTARFPVNNVADLVAICADRSLFNIMLLSNITLDRNMIGYNFEGRVSQIVDIAGFAIDESTFRRLLVTGAQAVVTTLPPWFDECYLYTLTAFNASIVHGCILAAAIGLGGNLVAFECAFYAGFTLQTNGRNFNITGSTGELTVTQYNAGGAYSYLEMLAGKVTFAGTCTLGTIEIRGDFVLFDNSAGTVVVDYRVSTHISAIEDAVYFDSVGGVAGTTYPIGTPQHPVNNEADLFAILVARGLRKVILLTTTSTLTFSAARSGYNFIGEGVLTATPTVNFNGKAITNCVFKNLRINDTTASNLLSTCDFVECYIMKFIAHTVGGSNYHNCTFQAAGVTNPQLGIVNLYGSAVFLGNCINGSGQINAYCNVIAMANLRNNNGLITITGNLWVDYLYQDGVTATGDIRINGDVWANDVYLQDAGRLFIFGNLVVAAGDLTNSNGCFVYIYGNVDIRQGYLTNYDVSNIDIFGHVFVTGDIVSDTPNGDINISGDCQLCYLSQVLGHGNMQANPFYFDGGYRLNGGGVGSVVYMDRVRGYGEIEVVSFIAGTTLVLQVDGGTVTIANTCTGGTLYLSGNCSLINNGAMTIYDNRKSQNNTRFFQEIVAATDVNGVTWKDLLDRSVITKPVRVCGFTVTKGGVWLGFVQVRIVDGVGTTKIFPFKTEYEEPGDFALAAQVTFNFPVEVSISKGYKFQFRSTNAGDGAGETLALTNLDVQELS